MQIQRIKQLGMKFNRGLLMCALFLAFDVLLLAHCAAGTPQAEKAKPLVVAHWILPMKYESGESWDQTVQNDIRAAKELGVDGFALDVFNGKQAKNLISDFIKAADAIGAKDFKVFLSADMSLKFSAEDIVDTLKTYGDNPHYLKINGKPLLSTYDGGSLGADWWENNVLQPLASSGKQITFIPYFDRPNPNGDSPSYENWKRVLEKYSSVDGLFNFLMPGSTPFYSTDENIGHHWWSILEAEENLARAVHDSKKIFMAPFMPYYWAACHPVRQYMEHQGGRGMDNYWTSIIEKQKPEIVEIVTWNDYSESTFIQPTRLTLEKAKGIKSQPHLGYYELMKYYVSWYKNGRKPDITRDGLFFFYRTHPLAATASDDASACALGPISNGQKWGLIKDVIYVTTAMTKPAILIVKSGSTTKEYSVPEGLHTLDVPFQPGEQTFSIVRNDKKQIETTGTDIVADPVVYNFNVYSGYAIAGAQSSETWLPSDAWKSGFMADWFTQ